MLKEGNIAPDFILESSSGKKVALSSLRGKKVALYFYPKDNTPGCTTEACDFRDSKTDFDSKNTVVIGVSKDSIKSHNNFIEKHKLNFELLSDPDTDVCQSYGVWGEKKMCGKTYMGIIRSTFLIDEEGIIAKIYKNVKVKGHANTVLGDL